MSRRIAIIAAMKREVEPLLERWRRSGAKVERKMVSVIEGYECEGVWVIVAGIGRKRAATAARIAIEYHQPETIISTGLAGGLQKGLGAGAVFRPEAVIDGRSGEKYRCERDSRAQGVLVTAASVLSRKEKEELARKFSADAVDMEAAVVAEVAHASGTPFVALKAISDELEFEMPPLGRFVDPEGHFHLLKLIGYAALRPRTWGALGELRRNSRMASEALARELGALLNET